jgi:hypothetical protein
MLNFSRFTISTNDRSAATEGAKPFSSQDVSTPTGLHFYKRIRMLALLVVCMAPCLMSYAQTQAYGSHWRRFTV